MVKGINNPSCEDSQNDDGTCDKNYSIAPQKNKNVDKVWKNKKRSTDYKCSKYDVNGCKLPSTVFYYSNDSSRNVPGTEYSNYKYKYIVKNLRPVKTGKENQRRCECDYMVTYNWAKLNGESLWEIYKKNGLWGDDGVYNYLSSNGIGENNEKLKYEIMKLLCEGLNTTNPRPQSFQSPKTFFDTKTTLTVLDFMMALMSLFIIVRATGTYKEYIQKLSGNKNMWVIFIIMLFVVFGGLFGLQFIGKEDETFKNIYMWVLPSLLFLVIITSKISSVRTAFIYLAVFYMAFLIGTQLWLSIPSPWTEGETAGVFEFFAIILQKAGILDYVPKMLFGDSIKSTSGPKWNVPLIPATIMMINALLGVGKSPADLISGYKSKMKKMSKRSDIDVFQIDADIGDIGF